MEEEHIIPQNDQRNDYGNANTAIVSGSDMNASHNHDSSSQCFNSSLEDRHHDGDRGHIDGKDGSEDVGGMSHDSDQSENEDFNGKKCEIPSKDVLYNPNLDEEDEAWVYEHKRGGDSNRLKDQLLSMIRNPSSSVCHNREATLSHYTKKERTNSKQKSNNDNTSYNIKAVEASRHGQKQSVALLKKSKPRTSDAVLSCPCCFEIVCMDCQRHERYSNQFRAMFVMNIGVSWDVTICPEHLGGENIDVDKQDTMNAVSNDSAMLNNIPVANESKPAIDKGGMSSCNEDIYYSVYCNKCRTVVAGLNMQDEVYHFFGCLATG